MIKSIVKDLFKYCPPVRYCQNHPQRVYCQCHNKCSICGRPLLDIDRR
ncbi:MAG: hypothetical protein GPJ52_04185 [Candidatus Heimdallarchaeota archaeon]|nr:hypothetical protein [Candidatus Heimdallarchaeota archaeon]